MTYFCTECGKPLPEDATFCGSCGAKAEAQMQTNPLQEPPKTEPVQNYGGYPIPPYPDTPAPKNKPRLVGIILIAVFGVILLGSGIWFFFLRDEEPTADTANNPLTEETFTEEPATEETGSELTTSAPLTTEEVAGRWDVTFRRFISIKENGATEYEIMGMEETFLEMEVQTFGEEDIYVILTPTSSFVNGEQYPDSDLAGQEVYADGTLKEDVLSFYLETDAFYLYTTMPILVEAPLAVENGKLSGTYEIVLEELIEGHEMQYIIDFELVQR